MHVDNTHYGLSLKILRLGNCVLPGIGIQEIARPELLEINNQTKETVALHEYMENDRVIIDVVECSLPLKLVLRRGEVSELTSGATGKIFLAHNLEGQKKYIKKHRENKTKFEKEMKRIRGDGYAVTTNSRTPGSAGIAVPVFDMNDQCRHSIGIYGPETRVIPRLKQMVELLIGAADRISSRAGSSRATQQ
jgi:DNA-binding IclR family transcriptional regulator